PRGEKDTIKSAAERYGVSRKTRCDTSVTFERARRQPSARASEKEAPTKEVGARPGAAGAGRANQPKDQVPAAIFSDAELSAMVAALEVGLPDSSNRQANVLRFKNPAAIADLCFRAANIMQPRERRVAAGGQP